MVVGGHGSVTGEALVKKPRILVVLLSVVLTVGTVGAAQARSTHRTHAQRSHAGSTAALAPSVASGPASATTTYPVGTTTITVAAPTRNITVLVRYPATSAGANKPVAAGIHPLIVVGHGAAGSGADSTNLHNFLAADGYIVAGPSFGNIVSKLSQGAGEVSATITYLINLKTG